MFTPWKKSYDQSRQHIKKQRHYFANKGPSSQGYGFSSCHVCMWELVCEEGWALKNWCFWTVVLEKILESPLDCRESQPVHPKGNQSWIFIGRTDVEAETSILWPPDVKSLHTGKDLDAGKDWRQEEKGTTEDEMAEWHHRLDGHEFEWTPRVGNGQAWRAVIHGVTKNRTQLSDWTELNWTWIRTAKSFLPCDTLQAWECGHKPYMVWFIHVPHTVLMFYIHQLIWSSQKPDDVALWIS